MKRFILILLLIPVLLFSESSVSNDCMFQGKKLYGRIMLVSSNPDLRVRSVNTIPDLRVQAVTTVPNRCGEWQMVTSNPDLRIQIDPSFGEFTIQFVESFPGVGP
ncbi:MULTISPECIES: hypothetical protein [Leptospira]|uniref:7(1) septoil knot domain-containing protein n=1 Tax=Leptospira weilii str. 2006001853 TaxID=1001589 RepID=A0A828Z7E1_9LEPT|nr:MULTISPECIES: hypothetical protein [Leptospira]EKR65797.1 hypothetical protein LEP1GSC036_2572 [Leptospira weilii str. 2006001853]EMJ63457.1 hypothetical protein LEP1GSC051_2567 [Leptospira sp. P2653]EMN44756.1 hypothetical protein LEP1GSC086_4190 [Leptospira weilii str. LNT 1234]QDK21535.1 hypothetical protein FHG67_01245 [Leptospira weilii]QDK24939.1 hypothetical protein FHG67_19695 [Leptospira weilii]